MSAMGLDRKSLGTVKEGDWIGRDKYRVLQNDAQKRLQAIAGNANSAAVYNKGMNDIADMSQRARQAGMFGGMKAGDFGGLMVAMREVQQASAANAALTDKFGAAYNDAKGNGFAGSISEFVNGELAKGNEEFAEAQEILDKYNGSTSADRWGELGDRVLGDAVGSISAGAMAVTEALAAGTVAENRAELQNELARADTIAAGELQAQGMNRQAEAQAGQMTDNAIAQANAFDAGMQGIGMSGIEGSGNMERNLQYGQDRADAAEQLAFDAQRAEGEGLERSMANTFSDLSQYKAGAIADAVSGSMGNFADNQFANRQAASEAEFAAQPTPNDYNKVIVDAENAAGVPEPEIKQNQTPGQPTPPAPYTPTAPTGDTPAVNPTTPAASTNNDSVIDAWLQANHRGVGGAGWAASAAKGDVSLPPGVTSKDVAEYVGRTKWRPK